MNPTFKLEWLLDVAKKQQQTGGIDGWGESNTANTVVFFRACLLLLAAALAAYYKSLHQGTHPPLPMSYNVA